MQQSQDLALHFIISFTLKLIIIFASRHLGALKTIDFDICLNFYHLIWLLEFQINVSLLQSTDSEKRLPLFA